MKIFSEMFLIIYSIFRNSKAAATTTFVFVATTRYFILQPNSLSKLKNVGVEKMNQLSKVLLFAAGTMAGGSGTYYYLHSPELQALAEEKVPLSQASAGKEELHQQIRDLESSLAKKMDDGEKVEYYAETINWAYKKLAEAARTGQQQPLESNGTLGNDDRVSVAEAQCSVIFEGRKPYLVINAQGRELPLRKNHLDSLMVGDKGYFFSTCVQNHKKMLKDYWKQNKDAVHLILELLR